MTRGPGGVKLPVLPLLQLFTRLSHDRKFGLWPCGVKTCGYLFMNSPWKMILQNILYNYYITIINWYHVHHAFSIFQKSLLCFGLFWPSSWHLDQVGKPTSSFLPLVLMRGQPVKTHRYKPLHPRSTHQPTVDQPLHRLFLFSHSSLQQKNI